MKPWVELELELLPQPVRSKMWYERSKFAYPSAFPHGDVNNA